MATQCEGKISGTLTGAPDTFVVKDLVGLNGAVAPAGEVICCNVYEWETFVLDAGVRIEWDQLTSRWIPINMAIGSGDR
jgi:hypothetical protein